MKEMYGTEINVTNQNQAGSKQISMPANSKPNVTNAPRTSVTKYQPVKTSANTPHVDQMASYRDFRIGMPENIQFKDNHRSTDTVQSYLNRDGNGISEGCRVR